MFQKVFSFEGRIRRKEFGITTLIYFIVNLSLNLSLLPSANEMGYYEGGVENGEVIYVVVMLPLLWIQFAQGAKRCHDINKSGWWQLIPFYIFVMLFTESHYGMNQYGQNPKGEGNLEDQFDFLNPANAPGDTSAN